MAEGESKSRLLPAAATFVVVAGVIWIVGLVATAILKNVILPLLALIVGFAAARVVYKVRD